MRVDSKTLEYGFGVIHAGRLSFFGFGMRGRSYSNFLASTLGITSAKKKQHDNVCERSSIRMRQTRQQSRNCGLTFGAAVTGTPYSTPIPYIDL